MNTDGSVNITQSKLNFYNESSFNPNINKNITWETFHKTTLDEEVLTKNHTTIEQELAEDKKLL